MSPWAPAGTDAQNLLKALCAMAEPIAELVLDVGSPDDPADFRPGWSVLLDPDTAPAWALPYTGMFVGIFVAPGTPEAEARALIKAHSGWRRGTLGGIVATAQQFLTGMQTCIVIERTAANGSEDAYHFLMFVRPSEVANATALKSAVDATKPAGVQWTLVIQDGEAWSQASRAFDADTTTFNQKG